MFDFTLKKYEELCGSIVQSGYGIVMVERYFSQLNLPEKYFVLRHDVDRKPERAEAMASLEDELGIKSTYYFRKKNHVFKPDIIKRISGMGHEIGYHYEVLDKAKGDIKKAYSIFKEELEMFRDIVDVKTVAMHGNPLTRWTNSDFWKNYDLGEFKLIGDVSFSLREKNVLYFTDTGRSWHSSKYNIKDFISNSQIGDKIQSTSDLINFILNDNEKYLVCLSSHPNRWNNDPLSWLLQYAEDYLANRAKLAVRFLNSRVRRDRAND